MVALFIAVKDTLTSASKSLPNIRHYINVLYDTYEIPEIHLLKRVYSFLFLHLQVSPR